MHALDKRIQSKCKFLDFQLLAWKLTKFVMSFFNPEVSFRWNFTTNFSVMIHNSSEMLYLKQYMFWTERTHQCTIFRLIGALMKFHPIPHSIFGTTSSGLVQILHHCSVSWYITPPYFFSWTCASREICLLYFFSWTFIWFLQKEPTTVQTFRLSTPEVEFH